jgi:large subunit ribosomal protein L7/L12
MNDEENNKEAQSADAESKVEESVDEAKEAANQAEDAAAEATEAAEEAKEAAEEVKEVVAEVKEAKTEEPKQEEKKPAKEVSKKLEDIISDIENLSVLELADLVKALEDRFGVTAAAPVTMAAPAAGAGSSGGDAGEAADEGQTSFNVILADGGANKIGVIKAVREIVPTLGLKEAKDLVDGAPKPVLEGAGKEAANEAKAKLEAAGGKVELK